MVKNISSARAYARHIVSLGALGVLLIVVISLILPMFAQATPPSTMNFQGRLLDSTGAIRPDGQYNMQFRIYDAATGGTQHWSETRQGATRVQVTNGLFSVQLGQVTPLPASLFDATNLYFEITMPTPATATAATPSWESPMTPRSKLATSAYAFKAAKAADSDALGGQTASFFQNATNLTSGTINSARITGAYAGITGVGNITSGTWNGTTISIARGGTGATTVQAARNNLSGLTTAGDLLFHNGTNSTRLARGTAGQCLTSNATSLQWGSCGLTAEADTLASVTARGATTATPVTLAGGATVGSGNGEAALIINGGTAGSQRLSFATAGATTWSTVAMGGGTNPTYAIQRYSSGIYVDSPISINNTTGAVNILHNTAIGTNALFVDSTNKRIGIGTTTPEVALDVSGGQLTRGSTYVYNNVADYSSGLSNLTGTMKITMPKTWSNTMMRVTIKGYNLTGAGAWGVVVGGYNYTVGPTWVNTSAEIIGQAPFSDVRLAHDGTNNVILLGTTTTVWAHAKIYIEEVHAGHNSVSGWGTGWSIAPITTETGITNINSPAVRQTCYSTNNCTNLNAATLGGQTAAFFQNATNLTTGTISSARITGAYTGITGVGNITSGTWNGGTIAVARGGTGATTAQGAINNLSGLTAAGDILYHNGTNSTRLARGSTGQCLTSNATSIQWGSCGASVSLNNLTATSINQSLIANANNARDLGSAALGWRSGYFGTAVYAPLFDRADAGALNIGTTNATAITVGSTAGASSLSLNSGTGGVEINGSFSSPLSAAVRVNSLQTASGYTLNSATRIISVFDPTGTQDGAFFGNILRTQPGTTGATYTHDFFGGIGIVAWEASNSSSTATGRVVGMTGKVQNAVGAGAIVNAINVLGEGQIASGTSVTNMYNIASYDLGVASTGRVTNLYGLYSKHLTGGTASNYPLYLDSGNGYALTSVTSTGQAVFRSSVDQMNAFSIQSVSGQSILRVDNDALQRGVTIQGGSDFNLYSRDILAVQNGSGGSILRVSQSVGDQVRIKGGSSFWNQSALSIESASSQVIGVRVEGAIGQTADLVQYRNSDGVTLSKVTADGSFITSGRLGVGYAAGATLPHTFAVQGTQNSNFVASINNISNISTAKGLLINLGVPNTSRTVNTQFVGFAGAGTVSGKITGNTVGGVAYTTSGADYAEYFRADPSDLPQSGELVTLDPNRPNGVKRAAAGDMIAGIISTAPGFIGNGPICDVDDDDCDTNYEKSNVLVSLVGQVPVKVSGSVRIGDMIGASSAQGIATKVASGYSIGHALTSPDSSGYVQVLIRPDYRQPQVQGIDSTMSNLSLTGNLTVGGDLNVMGDARMVNLTIAQNLNVQGRLSVVGATSLGDLSIGGHLTSRGDAPTFTGDIAIAGATPAVIEGTDTAGTITITTGTAATDGVIGTVTFARAYQSDAKVLITATNEHAAEIRVYVKKTATGFELISLDPLVADTVYKFDYMVQGVAR